MSTSTGMFFVPAIKQRFCPTKPIRSLHLAHTTRGGPISDLQIYSPYHRKPVPHRLQGARRKLALVSHYQCTCATNQWSCGEYCKKRCPCILLANRQTYTECQPLLHNITRFSFCSSGRLRHFSESLNQKHMALVVHLSFEIGLYDVSFGVVPWCILDTRQLLWDLTWKHGGSPTWDQRITTYETMQGREVIMVSHSRCLEEASRLSKATHIRSITVDIQGRELESMFDLG